MGGGALRRLGGASDGTEGGPGEGGAAEKAGGCGRVGGK